MKKDDCIFCKLANGEIPTNTLYEDDTFRVILDTDPISRGHALILPKEHSDSLYDLPEEVAASTLILAKRMVAKMTEQLNCNGFNLVQNNGKSAGQTIFHFHMHLIPRYQGEGEPINWLAGSASAEELAEVKRLIVG